MIVSGMYVRCPVDREYPDNPRVFATGKVVSVNAFNETAHIKFLDPFGHRKYYDFIPENVPEVPLAAVDHCSLFKNSMIKIGKRPATIVEYKLNDNGLYDYYVRYDDTKSYEKVSEADVLASFFSGSANPIQQLKRYEFQNPCWYLGRQIVKGTMTVLDSSIFGFKELAGCKIYLKAFQLNTIMQCLQSEPCRYMLADEVGLGKTVEACSILKIYLSNKANKRVLIVVPRPLLEQWRTELLFKFGLFNGENENHNIITLISIDDAMELSTNQSWDFTVVDEVHNYLKLSEYYECIHNISKKTENIILLSATPIQQRKNEYLSLLRLILPSKYDAMSLEAFSELVEKQNKISRMAHTLLDDIDSFKNEVLPEVMTENPHEDEDVIDQLDEIMSGLTSLADVISDSAFSGMVRNIDTETDDFGMHSIQVATSYVCDNYQLERNIIRGRRAVLGVYPQNEDGEFSERKLETVEYNIDEDKLFYENQALVSLMSWIVSIQENLDSNTIETLILPIIESFFSSPWAYLSSINNNKNNLEIPIDVIKTAERWLEDENMALENLPDYLDDVELHPSRLIKLISYIDSNLFGKKVVVFTDYIETFNVYYSALSEAFGDEVSGFSVKMPKETAEMNIYRFQSDDNCKILVCDKSGGEGRNLQIADYVVHIDLPWNINTIEQRIGRLDRLGRDVRTPVTSVAIYSANSFEEQLFKFWHNGLNVFCQSLSGLEIIMNDINEKIIDAIKTDFEFGLYRLIPELISEAENMRETVHKEQLFDTAALRYKPLYIQLEKLLTNYQFNENELFSETMMSWASLAGFGELRRTANDKLIVFDENNFSVKSAQNSFLLPPDWDNYLSKKQNEAVIKVQRGLDNSNQKEGYMSRAIKGTFDRDTGIKNEYIHFYAPGDEIFDCIIDNAMHSYRGMCTAFAVESHLSWKGFIYTFSIEPNERLLLDNGVSLLALGLFRQYLATSVQIVPIAFAKYADVPEKSIILEHKRISQQGYFDGQDNIEHLGKRGFGGGFLNIPKRFQVSNAEWFKGQYPDEKWEILVDQSYGIAKKKAKQRFLKESNLSGAKEMIEQIITSTESRNAYFGIDGNINIEDLVKQFDIICESLEKPIIRLESACFTWLINNG